MAIKDRDGNVYQLRGPNPLMKTQQEWDRNSLQVFNLNKESEVVVDERSPVKRQQENVVDIGKELKLVKNEEFQDETRTIRPMEFIQEIQKPEPKVEPAPVLEFTPEPVVEIVVNSPEPEPVVFHVDDRLARLLRERGVEYHCAPVIGETVRRDELYGRSYTVPRYGTNFIFDAIVIDQSDFELQFWSVREITKGSIVYRKQAEGGERWWRIKEYEPKTGGFLTVADISDLNPDFS